MTKTEFNRLFLLELDRYDPKLKYLVTGTGGRHPLLRLHLLQICRQDIETNGLAKTIENWRSFFGMKPLQLKSSPPELAPTIGLQMNLSGRAIGGKQLSLTNTAMTP